MKKALLLVMTLTALSGCCGKSKIAEGKSDSDWFDDFIALNCARWEECMSDEAKAKAPHMAGGTCEADLRKAMIEFNGGGLPSPCDEGEQFHGEHAAECYEKVRTSSCDVILAGTWDEGACARMCR